MTVSPVTREEQGHPPPEPRCHKPARGSKQNDTSLLILVTTETIMIYRDPKCVFVGKDGASANLIAGILIGAGFPAEVMNEATLGGFEGITGLVPGYSHKGVEVWVVDPGHIEPAKQLLDEEMKTIDAAKEKRANRTGTISAECEECGRASDWPAPSMGTTETCPHCGAYMDIPDPDDEWSDVDFGASEEDDEAAPEDGTK